MFFFRECYPCLFAILWFDVTASGCCYFLVACCEFLEGCCYFLVAVNSWGLLMFGGLLSIAGGCCYLLVFAVHS